MASIVKRKSKWSVIYTCLDENGVKRQKWETFNNNADAKKRKAQVEFEQSTGTFITPSAKTLKELLDDYVSIYGINTWALSTYEGHKGLIDNYIIPLLGDTKLDDITPRMMDKFYQSLLKIKSKPRPYQQAKNEYLSARTVKEIHKILRNAFNQAVKWELISRNPVANATLPRVASAPRNIWTSETLFHALELCDDDLLSLAINMAFSCSLRMGEMLALTWDCIDISQESIRTDSANIYINKAMQRVSKQALDQLDGKGVITMFPPIFASKTTRLVLKEPKTKTSVRKVFLPRAVAEMLLKRKDELEELKSIFGDEFKDYNLVFCSTNGTPIEGQVINNRLNKLIAEHDLPKVVFHSLRHSSVTYKLKLNGGDIKAVQGDTGHAQASMVTERYAHIIDEDRKKNAQRMQEAFYSPESAATEKTSESDQALLAKLLANPQMAEMLKQLAKTL
ncbi:MAG: site-specific integrase [Oscillospiraceae bacterium]|nr:site-specific integrase [Oscillospiraceae bacterium]